MFHELPSRDRKDGLATGQPQGLESLTVRRRVRGPRTPGGTPISAAAVGDSGNMRDSRAGGCRNDYSESQKSNNNGETPGAKIRILLPTPGLDLACHELWSSRFLTNSKFF
jgi:hypothetical protein